MKKRRCQRRPVNASWLSIVARKELKRRADAGEALPEKRTRGQRTMATHVAGDSYNTFCQPRYKDCRLASFARSGLLQTIAGNNDIDVLDPVTGVHVPL